MVRVKREKVYRSLCTACLLAVLSAIVVPLYDEFVGTESDEGNQKE